MSFPFDPLIDQIRGALRGLAGDLLREELGRQFDRLSMPALAADTGGRYLAASPAALALTGYTLDEVLELTVSDVTPLPASADAQQLWNDFISSGRQDGQYDLRSRDGSITRVRYHAYANVAPGVHLSVLQSISSRSPESHALPRSGRVLY